MVLLHTGVFAWGVALGVVSNNWHAISNILCYAETSNFIKFI
jgi:hypothetical protein